MSVVVGWCFSSLKVRQSCNEKSVIIVIALSVGLIRGTSSHWVAELSPVVDTCSVQHCVSQCAEDTEEGLSIEATIEHSSYNQLRAVKTSDIDLILQVSFLNWTE